MWEKEMETEMKRDRLYGSGDCRTWLAVSASGAKTCDSWNSFPEIWPLWKSG